MSGVCLPHFLMSRVSVVCLLHCLMSRVSVFCLLHCLMSQMEQCSARLFQSHPPFCTTLGGGQH